jgi:hypothetical protein
MFKKGQKVVCINPIDGLELGKVYSVEKNSTDYFTYANGNSGYYHDRFIPLLTPNDIKIGDKLKLEYTPEVGKCFPNSNGIWYTSTMSNQHNIKTGSILEVTDIINVDGVDCIKDIESYSIPLMYLSKVEQTEMKTYTVPRSEFSQIYNLLCSTWREKVSNLLSKDLMSNDITIPESLIKEAYAEVISSDHRKELYDWLEKYFPKPKQKVLKTEIKYTNAYKSMIDGSVYYGSLLHSTKEVAINKAEDYAYVKGVKVTIEYEVEE